MLNHLVLGFATSLCCVLAEITTEEKIDMQSKFAAMESELNNLFQQTVSEVKNTVEGRVIQYKGREDYRKAMCAEQLGRTLAAEVQHQGRANLVALASYFKTRREFIVSQASSQQDLQATRQAVESGSASEQMKGNVNKFKEFVSQKMIEYLEHTTKC